MRRSVIEELHRVDPETFSILRRKRGAHGFEYVDVLGYPVDDPEALERIRSLVLPPAWRDVRICADPRGHIQAVGTDAAGRLQYRYHPFWRVLRDREKFDEMLGFAEALPAFRQRVSADLRRRDLSRRQILACTARLLDLGMFRIGRERYTKENGTFGLATLRREHVHLAPGGRIAFDYIAKGQKERKLTVVAPAVHRTLSMLFRHDADGAQIFSYLENGWWVNVRSGDINDYVKDAFAADYSAKDFRTWNATVIAATRIAAHVPVPESERARKRAINSAVAATASILGNTPAVCRSSYIDPRVFERFEEGQTIALPLEQIPIRQWPLRASDRRLIEEAVVSLLAASPATPDLTATLMSRLPSRAATAHR